MKIRCLSWSGERPSPRIAPKTAASLPGKPASISVNPSSPSIRKAFANPIGTMCTPLITRFTAISETGWYNPSMDDWRRWAYRPLLHSPLFIPESAARELESL